MRSFIRPGLTLLGLSAVFTPAIALAQNAASAGYAPPTTNVMVMGLDGKPVIAQLAPAPVAAPASIPAQSPARHSKKFGMMPAHRAKNVQMTPPTGRIVACAHSKNGVCPTCQALLEMPGTVTMGAPSPAPSAEVPGRAMVSNQPTARPSASGMNQVAQMTPVAAVYDPSTGPEPTPIGVMQTNYAQPGMAPVAPSSIPSASSMQPGHALAASGASPAPYQHKSTSSANPHVLGHIFGYAGVASEWREERNKKKSQAHASIPYNSEGTTINEIPASMVYGNR